MAASGCLGVSRLKSLVGWILPSLVVLLSLEGIARIVTWRKFASYQANFSNQADSRWIEDDTLIWANRPFYLEYDRSSQYNGSGMRVDASDLAVPEKGTDDFWVLCLGGSAMAGVGSSRQGDWIRLTGIHQHPRDRSIDGRLRNHLQRAMPGRRVCVFNAAVSGYTLEQSRLMVERLAHVPFDFVISLDGYNEPVALGQGETVRDILQRRWSRHVVNRPQFRLARWMMRHSALVFLCGETVFFRSGLIRTGLNSRRDPDLVRHWMHQSAGPTDKCEQETIEAQQVYLSTMWRFHEELERRGIGHLLLFQPYLGERDPAKLEPNELALYHYFRTVENRCQTEFITSLREAIDAMDEPWVWSLEPVHDADGWMFLDACHLTAHANDWIARALASRIIAEIGSDDS